jgi:NTP pyrophosphatase (non-canonical NTP hydrolase)
VFLCRKGVFDSACSYSGKLQPPDVKKRNSGDMKMNKDSYQAMLETVQAFHDKHDFRNTGGEELAYRVALMTEELGEISSCVTKGKDTGKLAEECADLLILVIGTAIAADFDLRQAFWEKMEKIMRRDSRMINGRIRVSEFRDT